MSNPHPKRISLPDLAGQTKTLFLESPGRAAVLIANGQPTAMDFKNAHEALDWCEVNRAIFYYLPAAQSEQN